MKRLLSAFLSLFILSAAISAQTRDFTRYVHPLIGTGGHGHTFPGASVPFGMVQLSPDTRTDNWDGSGGYYYADSTIFGFSHTHLNGTGIPDYCDVLFMPTVGAPEFSAKSGEKSENGYASKFSHQNEKAEAGYYSVKLDDDNIFAEMAATTRVGLHRYTFPKSDEANIVLDLKWRDKVLDSGLKTVGRSRVEGFRRSGSWAKNQIIYFVAEFSKPFIESKTEETLTRVSHEASDTRSDGSEKKKDLKAVFQFKTKANEQILLKVALSSVSIEGARKNLQAELPDWDFERVRQNAKNAWNKELSKVKVSGGTDEQLTNFYTALYHTQLQPNVFEDVDGKYLGHDRLIHEAKDFTNHTVFSLWDTFRAAHPLYTIIDQKRTVDFINTFLKQYEQGGRLPVWELAANETDTMIGYHAVSVISDAMAKGIKGFDYEEAFEAAKHSAELNHFGLEAYKKRGYISSEDEQESVSKTLEYAYDDFCIAQMAKILANLREAQVKKSGFSAGWDSKYLRRKSVDYQRFIKRAGFYKNLFDKQSGFMRPKRNGGWVAPFEPQEVTFHFTEGNSWQYSFFVPQDVAGLMEMQGGSKNFAKKLDELFTTETKLSGREQPDLTGLIGQYAHGNEPSHHIAYLYDYAGEPWKTQRIVRRILDEFYKPTPDGLIGNEDCGQMSAWYVLSALGIYQVNPSQPVYAFGTPLFPEAKINLENGKTFTIKAANASAKNFYVQSAALNGKPYRKSFLAHEDLMRGGVLEFTMGDAPNKNFGVNDGEMPISSIKEKFPIVSTIEAPRVFENETTVKISTPENSAKIFYTTDGSEPNNNSAVYTNPFKISATTLVKAVSENSSGQRSSAVESKLNRIPHDWDVKLLSTYNRQYTGGGAKGLIDGIRGTTNFASSEWQGYQAQDFVAVIDLKRETEIHKLGGGFLQNAGVWIWMPTRVEFEVSMDGSEFRKIADIKTDVTPENMQSLVRDYVQKITPVKTRFVRIKAYNFGKIPAWHPGAGSDAFIFVDEIIIE